MKGTDQFSIIVPLGFIVLIGAWIALLMSRWDFSPAIAVVIGLPAGVVAGIAILFGVGKIHKAMQSRDN